jgi:CHASE1-domain containing sensor protein
MTLENREAVPASFPADNAPTASRPLRPRVLPWVVLACTLVSTFAVAYYVWSKDRLRADSAAREAAQAARDRVESRLNNYALLLRGAAGLMSNQLLEGSDQIPARSGEFATYVQRLELPQNNPSVRSLGFNLRLRADERERFETAMRAAGVEGYSVWSNEQGREKTQEVFPVVFAEPPTDRNRSALGFDPYSEGVRRAAMSRARDDAAPIATGVVTLANRTEQASYPGIVLFLPIYHTGEAPPTVAARRAELAGFVFAGIRSSELLEGAFPSTGRSASIDLSIYDGETLVDRTDEPASPEDFDKDARVDTAPADVDRTIEAAGRTWTIAFRPHAHQELSFRPVVVPAIVVVGSALAFMLFLLTNSEGTARMRAERAARELEASREALVKTNASLRESESRLRTLTDANIVGMLIADASGRIYEANDAFLRLVGRSRPFSAWSAARGSSSPPASSIGSA